PLVAILLATTVLAAPQDPERVNEKLLSTYQRLEPAGWSLQVPGRPVDIALSKDGTQLWVKDNTGLRLVQIDGWKEVGFLASEGGSSLKGLRVSGGTVFFSNSTNQVHKFGFR